ncbi:VOC family protein (plasmid) [Pseudomonas aeruginosa]|uniref:Fosfomycin resistance protein FosA n=4 Tax=Pseudomonas TaxID=286 RepID=A0A5P9WAG7_PSEAI|nr:MULTISPECIES: VOC family protein [Pseudomonas]EKF8205557.1 VOC family protein [Pseudomonas aeruginosa]EKI0126931.1 VOC family protein [Pseudomonas aeruginosa]MBM0727487.1 VOC family protein [Pseudomonas aeruginosa]MBM2546714.1 VOC family protein [Pseudomonas aeruginosa]MBM2557721.1 VOC family protein [Pseudomonas aeruginosa]
MLTGFNHLTLAVCSLPRSIAFYEETLGFKLSARWKTGAYLSLGDLWLCLSSDSVRAEDMQRNYTHYAFSIDQKNFAEFSQRLRELNVPLWRQDKSEGDSLYFLDPDGHQLEAHVGDLKSRLATCRSHPYSEMEFFD